MIGKTAMLALWIVLALAAGTAQAAEPEIKQCQFTRLSHFDEFIVGMCLRSRAGLLDDLLQQRSVLDTRRAALRLEAGDGSLTAQDIVLTILLPGGLLYAAHRHDVMQRAQVHLQEVRTRMQEITAEVDALSPPQTLTASVK